MALTIAELAAAMKLTGGEAPPEPLLSILTRLEAASRATIDLLAPTAPAPIADEAVIRMAAWLYDRDPAQDAGYRSALRSSGAAPLLEPWLPREAVVIGDGEAAPEPARGGGGTGGGGLVGPVDIDNLAEAVLARMLPEPTRGHAGRIAQISTVGRWIATPARWAIENLAPAIVARIAPALTQKKGQLLKANEDETGLEFGLVQLAELAPEVRARLDDPATAFHFFGHEQLDIAAIDSNTNVTGGAPGLKIAALPEQTFSGGLRAGEPFFTVYAGILDVTLTGNRNVRFSVETVHTFSNGKKFSTRRSIRQRAVGNTPFGFALSDFNSVSTVNLGPIPYDDGTMGQITDELLAEDVKIEVNLYLEFFNQRNPSIAQDTTIGALSGSLTAVTWYQFGRVSQAVDQVARSAAAQAQETANRGLREPETYGLDLEDVSLLKHLPTAHKFEDSADIRVYALPHNLLASLDTVAKVRALAWTLVSQHRETVAFYPMLRVPRARSGLEAFTSGRLYSAEVKNGDGTAIAAPTPIYDGAAFWLRAGSRHWQDDDFDYYAPNIEFAGSSDTDGPLTVELKYQEYVPDVNLGIDQLADAVAARLWPAFAGNKGKIGQVKQDETGIDYIDLPAGGGGGGGGGASWSVLKTVPVGTSYSGNGTGGKGTGNELYAFGINSTDDDLALSEDALDQFVFGKSTPRAIVIEKITRSGVRFAGGLIVMPLPASADFTTNAYVQSVISERNWEDSSSIGLDALIAVYARVSGKAGAARFVRLETPGRHPLGAASAHGVVVYGIG